VRKLVAALLGLRPRRVQPLSASEKFSHFRAIGAANDAFLNTLALLSDRYQRGGSHAMGAAVSAYESLSAPVGAMVKRLIAMSGGQYESLLRRFEAIDRELEVEVLKGRAIEYGPLIVWPEDGEGIQPQVVGPKSARLAEIQRSTTYRVPPFFAVSIYAYRMFMEATGLEDLIHQTLWSSDLADPRSLRVACASIRSAILDASVPPRLAGTMVESARKLRANTSAALGFAVRSSAVVEDSVASFAGQFESVLNVLEDGLPDAYKQVLASKYRPETVQYATACGFLDQEVTMPVLVMSMVEPEASGVAYSQEPENPSRAVVTAVRGLAQPMVEGRVTPDRFLLSREDRWDVVASMRGVQKTTIHCHPAGGIAESSPDRYQSAGVALEEENIRKVAQAAFVLEKHFGVPQDVEWAIDRTGSLFIVQSRPIGAKRDDRPRPDHVGLHGYRILLRGAVSASRGAACGRVYHHLDLSEGEEVPAGVVLVVPHAPPRLAALIPKLAALISVAGSPTGHMATVAREFGVPCLVGVEDAFGALPLDTLVTVDGWEGTVYEGEVRELVSARESTQRRVEKHDPVGAMVGKLMARVAPLTLTDPDSPEFQPEKCQTLHDIARFVHQRAMVEMFEVPQLSRQERSQARALRWRIPIELLVVDLGGGLVEAAGSIVSPEEITSVPLSALIEGMMDPRLKWSGPIGFDLKGFMSVVVRSTADDQRYGEASYAVCARDFVHLNSRLAYHFATVEAICGESINENYIRFRFYGGGAEMQRREWRGHFLAAVLTHNRFKVKQVADRVDALFAKHRAPVIEEALVMLGRLMVASRQLDMVMQSRAAADVFAQSFLAGDYQFEFVRQRTNGESV